MSRDQQERKLLDHKLRELGDEAILAAKHADAREAVKGLARVVESLIETIRLEVLE
jgi:hypothetical protein